jgi:hypothetical protein
MHSQEASAKTTGSIRCTLSVDEIVTQSFRPPTHAFTQSSCLQRHVLVESGMSASDRRAVSSPAFHAAFVGGGGLTRAQ